MTVAENVGKALLILDYQVGAGDQPFAKTGAEQAAKALSAAREAKLPIIFSKINFLPNYVDVASSNKVFATIRDRKMFAPGTTEIIPALKPMSGETVVSKDRFSAFSGNGLQAVLRAGGIGHLVMAGVATSGVILSTFIEAEDQDYRMTILSDACADSDSDLQTALMTKLFTRSADVQSTKDWIAIL